MNFVRITMRVKFAVFLLLLSRCLGVQVSAQTPAAEATTNAPYMNPQLPIDVRVDDLVSRMTLEEKASQLVNQARAIPRLNVPEYDYWSEGLHGVANAGF